MAKRRPTPRQIRLDFIDAIMQRTVPRHETQCDEGKCTLEGPCAYCWIGDVLMEELKRLDAAA